MIELHRNSRFIGYKVLLLMIVISFILTGCWGKKELNEISLVAAVGIDKSQNGGIQASVLVTTPIGGAQMAPSDKSNVWFGTAEGPSLLEALRNLDAIATRKLVWYHNRFVIIGEAAAKENLKEITDFYARSRESRFASQVLVTEGTALDMLQVPADIQRNLPMELDGIIKNAEEWSKAYIPDLKDFLVNIADKYTDNLVGRVKYYKSSRNTYSTNREEYRKQYWIDREFGIAAIEGSAVIKNENFAGFLNDTETRGYLWITNKVKTGVITAEGGDGQGYIVLDFRKSDAEITPRVSGKKIGMDIKLKVKGRLAETTSNLEILRKGDIVDMEHLWEKQIKKEMESAVRKAQKEYAADIFGFNGYINRKYPKFWKSIENDWNVIYPSIEVNYDVKVILRRFGKTSDTLAGNE